MTSIQAEIQRFRVFLEDHGQKLTSEREALVREIFSTHYHFEADELLFRMKQAGAKISRATIYRALDLLVKSGMVRRVHLGEDHFHYERVTRDEKHHDHLVCTMCGAVVEFHDPDLEDRRKRICDEHDFEPTFHNLQILGVCKRCRKKGEQPDAPDRVQMIEIRKNSLRK